MTSAANAVRQLRTLREAAPGVKALSRLSEPDFDNMVTAVENAVRSVIKAVTDQATRRQLENGLRQFQGAAGKVSLHMLERYENPDLKIEGWSKYWIDLDTQAADLGTLLEGLGGSSSAAFPARSVPRPVVVRLNLPEDEADDTKPGSSTA